MPNFKQPASFERWTTLRRMGSEQDTRVQRIGWVALYLKVDPDTVALEPGFSRDVRGIGHWGTGDLELILRTLSDLERAKPLILRSYEVS